MTTLMDSLMSLNQSNLEATRKFAAASCASFERIAKLQMETTKDLVEGALANTRAFWTEGSSSEPLAKLPQTYETYWNKSLAAARECVDVATKAQSEFAHLLVEQTVHFNDSMRQFVVGLAAQSQPSAEEAAKVPTKRAHAEPQPRQAA